MATIWQRLINAVKWNPSSPTDPNEFLKGVDLIDISSSSGKIVTAETSKNIATAYRCINILSDDVAKLPLQTFISRGIGQIERIRPSIQLQNVAWLLEISPNRWMTPLVFKKMTIMWLLTYGAAYIWQPPRRAGQRRELFVLRSDETWPDFDVNGMLWYRTKFADGRVEWLPDVEILPLLINSVDGISGRSVITYARETMGRQLGAYETQGKFYAQGLTPGGVAYFAGELNKDAREKVRRAYSEAMSGSANVGKLAVFDSKVTKFEVISMKPVDAQFLESIQENDSEIANFFGLPLYKLNQGKQSYQSNEQQNLDYLNTTLDPYLVQWEQAAAIKLLTEEEQNYTYFRFNREALLRTDAKTRADYLSQKIQNGQMTPNEARQIEDMPAYPGGDKFYMPANILSIPTSSTPVQRPAPGSNGGEDASN